MRAVMELIKAYARIIRFIISGGTGSVVNLSVLFVLVHFFSWYPVYASIASFISSFFVSFTLQKLWTYKNYDKSTAGTQMFTFFAIALFNLGLNTLMMYGWIEYSSVHYLAAQIITSGLIAIESFFLYKHFVFHPKSEPVLTKSI